MEHRTCTKEVAEAANYRFELEMSRFLRNWARRNRGETLLLFDQPLDQYLANDALRDFFLNRERPMQCLLKNRIIARHIGRSARQVYFDTITGDPLLAPTEYRIYNLARRMESEQMHVPFRSVNPNKQTHTGDAADIATYPINCEELRYNSGNHFRSRPANGNVFDDNSQRCVAKSAGNLHVIYKRGYLGERLQDIKLQVADMQLSGETQPQFFVICSRHSLKEGHYGVSLVIMDPQNPDYPTRVMVCDTLLKDLPHHPRWWFSFITEFSNVFGDAIAEMIEDISHPLQKVNIKGDEPYRHDWDCPYYAASMADALARLVRANPGLVLNGDMESIYAAMKKLMPDYYKRNGEIKTRADIQLANRLKRWKSGQNLIRELVADNKRTSSYEF